MNITHDITDDELVQTYIQGASYYQQIGQVDNHDLETDTTATFVLETQPGTTTTLPDNYIMAFFVVAYNENNNTNIWNNNENFPQFATTNTTFVATNRAENLEYGFAVGKTLIPKKAEEVVINSDTSSFGLNNVFFEWNDKDIDFSSDHTIYYTIDREWNNTTIENIVSFEDNQSTQTIVSLVIRFFTTPSVPWLGSTSPNADKTLGALLARKAPILVSLNFLTSDITSFYRIF